VLLLLLSFLKLFHLLFLLQRNADVARAIQHYVQPQIVIVGDLYDMDLLYIVTEGSIICQLPQERILDAVVELLGSFYIYNVSYTQCKAILTSLEQALLEIGRGHFSCLMPAKMAENWVFSFRFYR